MGNDLNKQKKKPEEMISLDQLLPSTGGSMFSLARIAMLRATEIYGGSRPLVDHLPLDKSTTIAFKEIAAPIAAPPTIEPTVNALCLEI